MKCIRRLAIFKMPNAIPTTRFSVSLVDHEFIARTLLCVLLPAGSLACAYVVSPS